MVHHTQSDYPPSRRIKVVEIELSQPLEALHCPGYSAVQALVQFHQVPIGMIHLSLQQGVCSAAAIAQAIFPHYTWQISRELVRQQIAQPQTWNLPDLLAATPASGGSPGVSSLPLSITVAFCPQATANLTPCLEALQQLGEHLEILVIEAAPQSSDLEQQVNQSYSNLHYCSTPEPGRNAARNLAIAKAAGEILAFTDERAIVSANWVERLVMAFVAHPDVVAVTGLVLPEELETEAQQWFEMGYGLGRGCDRKRYSLDRTQPVSWPMLGTMQIGSGVNMAFRRQCLSQVGGFDPTLVRGDGGDWEIFSRLLLQGQPLLYEPTAMLRYRAPRSESELQQQLTEMMMAFYAYLRVGIKRHPQQWFQFVCLGGWKLARLVLAYLRPLVIPRHLIAAELRGVAQSLMSLPLTRAKPSQPKLVSQRSTLAAQPKRLDSKVMAVRTVDLHQPWSDLTDVTDYKAVRLYVSREQLPIGFADLEHHYQPISAAQLQQAIADQLWLELLAVPYSGDTGMAWAQIESVFAQHWLPATEAKSSEQPELPPLPSDLPISIIITTCDRPATLATCLRHLQAQQTKRPLEIIVADNRPSSGLTPPIVAQFPGVQLVSEPRPGGSYGRNAAIAASTSEIIVSVDDDVTVPPDWLEKLIAPLARPEVMVVTGNVLPLELETPAQVMFETLKGGLGEGFKPFEVDGHWWNSFQQSPPVWDLGVSANAAFRACIFSHPTIGLMDEVLGPGTPTVGGEENHLIYKVLRAGYTLVYEPAAYVWHQHRRDLPALYRQVHGHMKGGTAYHLLLWLQEKDPRGLRQLVFELPEYYRKQIIARLRGQHKTPWRLLWSEISGYLAGFWGYWQSCQRVQQQGRSAPYIPVAARSAVAFTPAKPADARLPSELPEWIGSPLKTAEDEVVSS